MQALLLPLADDLYAVELELVREVVEAPATTPLPGGPAAVLGVFNLRGEVVPLLDTAALLGLGSRGAPAFVAVADTGAGVAGLAVDGRPEPSRLGDPAGPARLPATVARFAAGERVATLIDLEGLVERL